MPRTKKEKERLERKIEKAKKRLGSKRIQNKFIRQLEEIRQAAQRPEAHQPSPANAGATEEMESAE